MGISEILGQIPIIVSSFYDIILCLNFKENIFYSIDYNGEKIKSKILSIEDISNTLSNEQLDLIKTSNDINTIIKNINKEDSVINVKTINDYKLVFITNIKKNIKSNDKPVILIADDSNIITNFFVKTFEEDYNVLVAHDGNETIELVNANKDDILAIFLDLQMPNKNGYEVLEYFDKNNILPDIPVSIISGEDSKDGIQKAINVKGVVDMLQKPFNQDAARAIVNKTISFRSKR